MGDSRKKVLVRLLNGEIIAGHLPASGFVTGRGEEAQVELLDLVGRITAIPLADVARIAFVRDFNLADTIDPERLNRRTFQTRPRTAGLWLRLHLLGEKEPFEGLAAADLSLFDALIESNGLFLAPPDTRSNTQRIFVPRTAMTGLKVLAVIATPAKAKAAAERPAERKDQALLFPPV